MPVKPERAPLADSLATGGMALLIIDMISLWDFPDADKLAPAALTVAPRIGGRCLRAGVPATSTTIAGPWRSEFRALRSSVAESDIGAKIAQSLMPGDDDYSVLKPKHSAFYATPLDLLLRHLNARHLIVTGVASDQCIVMTASEAKMRDYKVVVPGDCVGAQTAARNAGALRHLREANGIGTVPSVRLRLRRRKCAHRR